MIPNSSDWCHRAGVPFSLMPSRQRALFIGAIAPVCSCTHPKSAQCDCPMSQSDFWARRASLRSACGAPKNRSATSDNHTVLIWGAADTGRPTLGGRHWATRRLRPAGPGRVRARRHESLLVPPNPGRPGCLSTPLLHAYFAGQRSKHHHKNARGRTKSGAPDSPSGGRGGPAARPAT